ncbi:MAG: hypothetical protein AB8D52_10010 [Gammaproteobacteria bacterium]
MLDKKENPKENSKISNFLTDRIDEWISSVMKIILAVGAVLEAIQGNWLICIFTIGIIFVAFLPVMLGYQFHVRIPPEFELLTVAFVCASLFLGEVHGFYEKYWWWDILLHASSGLILGIFGFLLVYVINEHDDLKMRMKPSFIGLFAFMFSLGMGTIWELVEFFVDQSFGMNMQRNSLVDTMSDLIVDAIGALIISILGYIYLSNTKSESFLERWIRHFIELNQQYLSHRKHKK